MTISKSQATAEDIHSILIHARKKIIELMPKGREQALALTKLDEADMWAIRSVIGTGVWTPIQITKTLDEYLSIKHTISMTNEDGLYTVWYMNFGQHGMCVKNEDINVALQELDALRIRVITSWYNDIEVTDALSQPQDSN